ncbi:hypothetical protein JE959_001626 [Aeromonas veronii]|nr:hypothetical protein [Aeromonas veronii]
MTAFMQNVLRHRAVNKALKPHGLTLYSGAVIDTTLPVYMHSYVCAFDHKLVDLNKPFDPMAHVYISAYLKGGRESVISWFEQVQANARAWANRPIVRGDVGACQ